jgi:hypothetical protein
VLEESAAEPEQDHGGREAEGDHRGIEDPDHDVGRDVGSVILSRSSVAGEYNGEEYEL